MKAVVSIPVPGRSRAGRWCTVLVAAWLRLAVHLSLWTRGFERTAARLARRSQRTALLPGPEAARLAQETITLVPGARLLGTPTLAESIMLWFLLRRLGIDAQLVISTRRPEFGPLPAHAWVELDGEPLNEQRARSGRYGRSVLHIPKSEAHATSH